MKNIFITLDCDPHPSVGIDHGLNACFDLFYELSLTEKVTWFVNELEGGFTDKHSSSLKKMSKGEIGLHTHLNRPPHNSRYSIPNEEGKLSNMISSGKKGLEDWLAKNSEQPEIISFRSGNLLTTNLLFRVLSEEGFKIDSSIPSQFDWSPREVSREIFDSFPNKLKELISEKVGGRIYPTLPLGSRPYRIGEILELPIHLYIGGRYTNMDWLIQRTKVQLEKVNDLVIYWHPFETALNSQIYRDYLNFLMENFQCEFKTLREKVGE